MMNDRKRVFYDILNKHHVSKKKKYGTEILDFDYTLHFEELSDADIESLMNYLPDEFISEDISYEIKIEKLKELIDSLNKEFSNGDIDYKENSRYLLNEPLNEERINDGISRSHAFFVLIKDVEQKNLNLLCRRMVEEEIAENENDAYNLLQNFDRCQSLEIDNKIFELACDIIYNGYEVQIGNEKINYDTLGNFCDNKKHNLSDWISHSFNVAKVTETLSKSCGIDDRFAFNYGLLHDYGRKYSHMFNHVTIGFKELYDLGLYQYATGTIKHSFMNASRFGCNEVAPDGYRVEYKDDGNVEEYFDKPFDGKNYKEIDEIADVLSGVKYNLFDDCLTCADDQATTHDIVSPSERVADIATRRPGINEAPNRYHFYRCFSKLLLTLSDNLINSIADFDEHKDISKIKASLINLNSMVNNCKGDVESIQEIFDSISALYTELYNEYSRLISNQNVDVNQTGNIKK